MLACCIADRRSFGCPLCLMQSFCNRQGLFEGIKILAHRQVDPLRLHTRSILLCAALLEFFGFNKFLPKPPFEILQDLH